jgi:protein gp37
MAQTTSIEWTDVSWNPVHGCSHVSTGCKHCYAETLSLRYGQTKLPWTARNATENVMLKPHKLREPLSKAGPWKQPCMVFVNSMSDLFHEQVPFKYITRVFETMMEAEQHTFQVLTKRPERMLAYFEYVADYMGLALADLVPWSNVWLGVSIENRKWVGRADVLREVPAAVRFISAEPLLGPLVYPGWTWSKARTSWPDGAIWPQLDLGGIDWLIAGGESGSGHRPLDLTWVRGLRDACATQGTAFFVKQLGGARPGTKLEDLPTDLRIRQMPSVVKPACIPG